MVCFNKLQLLVSGLLAVMSSHFRKVKGEVYNDNSPVQASNMIWIYHYPEVINGEKGQREDKQPQVLQAFGEDICN